MLLVTRDFTLTAQKIRLNVWVSIIAAIVSSVLCLFVLGAAAWIYSKQWARHSINRVSFRLLLWSMVFEVIYDLVYISVVVPTKPTSTCASGVYFMMATLGTVNYLCTCIALNLMLIVCFKVNPLEKRLERWYIGVSIALGMGVPIVPGALGHFGWDPILNVCWIKASDNVTRLKYFVLDLYLWQTLSCTVATLAVIATLISLFRMRRRSAPSADHALRNNPAFSIDTEQGLVFSQLQSKFFTIACLISLYPIALILVNGIITVGDLYISAAEGVWSKSVYALYCVYYFLYGGRGIFFAILGIFIDPCLKRGLKTVWRGKNNQPRVPREQPNPTDKASLLEILGGPTIHLEYETRQPSFSAESISDKYDRARSGSKASIELFTALSRLPMEVSSTTIATPPPPRAGLSRCLTKTFSGVHREALPEGLTDEVDVSLGSLSRQRDPYLEWTGYIEDKQEQSLDPLDPDLPDALEELTRRRKAAQVDKEEAIRVFEEAQTQL